MTVRLSILIPSFDYPEGVHRILSKISDHGRTDIEVLISDDSKGDHICHLAEDFSDRLLGSLNYRRNQPSLGAVNNWNALLDQAIGEYVLLLHHDEYPLNEEFVACAIDLLERFSKDVDVFVMDCILVAADGRVMRPHLPRAIRRLILNFFPSYLFKRNVVGPSSCLIVRRSLYPLFDDQLRWLVDVDAYYRLRMVTPRWYVCNDLEIASMQGRDDSITASLSRELRDLDARERIYLSKKHPQAACWLVAGKHRLLTFAEPISWFCMRMISYGFYRLAYVIKRSPNYRNLQKVVRER